jgi:hypothetical protein
MEGWNKGGWENEPLAFVIDGILIAEDLIRSVYLVK